MKNKERLKDILYKYFNIDDSYFYHLTRDKMAFQYGTMTFDDFKEFDDETIDDLATYITDNFTTIDAKELNEINKQVSELGWE